MHKQMEQKASSHTMWGTKKHEKEKSVQVHGEILQHGDQLSTTWIIHIVYAFHPQLLQLQQQQQLQQHVSYACCTWQNMLSHKTDW